MPSLLEQLAKSLPDDPGPALYEFCRRVEERILRPSTMVGTDTDHRAIVAYMMRFAQRFQLNLEFPATATSDYGQLEQVTLATMRQLETRGIGTDVDRLLGEYERGLSGDTFGYAKLNPEEKKKLHEHLAKIKQIVEQSTLSERKRNALFERIAELAREADLWGTKTDRFFAFAGDLAFVIGDMATKAKPALNEVREILKIVSRARARQEGISLPAGDEPLQLAPPAASQDDNSSETE